MFQHRASGRKPSDAFLNDFKSRIWHPPPRPTRETFKLGEDVYVEADGITPLSTVDVSSEIRCSSGDQGSALMMPSLFDEAVIDFEKASLPSLKLSTRQLAEDDPFESYSTGDQLSNPLSNSAHSARTDWDGSLFPVEFELTSDQTEYPSFSGGIGSMMLGRGGAKSCFGDDSSDHVASSAHSSKRPRFLTTLNAPVACSYERGEEMTYLDRDQAYLISISDSAPSSEGISPVKYHTSIQVSFENDQQKSHSAYYWSLWQSGHSKKEGNSEPLNGLEFAASSAAFAGIDQKVDFHLEETAVDRLTFTWTVMPGERPQCQFALSFHFVSTDFSQAKGVKGVPLRLSALTREITIASEEESRKDLQITHCLIKVYRNHGAERKTAIDSKQIEKKIEKVRQQIISQENALKAKIKRDQHKLQILSSEDSPLPAELPANHTLVVELKRLETATGKPKGPTAFRPRGKPEDCFDRGLFTSKEDPNDFSKMSIDQPENNLQAFSSMQWGNESEVGHSTFPSSDPVVSATGPRMSKTMGSSTWERDLGMASPISNPGLGSNPIPSLVQTMHEGNCSVKAVKWIKVIDTDESYRRPEPLPPKAVLCLYVRVVHPYQDYDTEDYYRAAYLKHRTVSELITCIADRCDFQATPNSIVGAFHVSVNGKVTMIDDEFVGGITNEQDMNVELIPAVAEGPKQSPSSDGGADIMDICIEPNKGALECQGSWYLRLRY